VNESLDYLKDYSLESIELFVRNSSHKSVEKGTVLQQKGDKLIKAFYVKKGLLRSYTIDEKGKEHIYMFAPENWLMTDVELLSSHSSAMLFIDALEDSELVVIGENVFKETKQLPVQILIDQISKLINRVNILQKRVLMLMSASAKERYDDFLQTYPQIVQRVPQRMIASYLGITPEALSKIRRQNK
jgi:CRP-like cAMP-binding protein